MCYGFSGKEQDDNGEWGDLTHYGYGARIYNPGIGRFLSVDPLSPEYPELTPFQYASNTPIVAVDADGLEAIWVHILGRSSKSKFLKQTFDEVKKIFDRRMRLLGVDLKLNYVNQVAPLSKDNFKKLEGYHSNDSYVVISDTETFQDLDFKSFGWQNSGIDAYVKTREGLGVKDVAIGGIKGRSASNDFIAAIDVNATTSTANANFSRLEAIQHLIEHESGHSKFELHPNSMSDITGFYVGHTGDGGHVANTILGKGMSGLVD